MTRRALIALGLLAALPARAEIGGAQPRPHVQLEAEVLRLSDIFENAGPRGAATLAAAPAPGQRMVLPARNLFNLARQYGLDWRPVTGLEQVVIERPGQPVPRDEIEALLREELLSHGVPTEAEIELPGLVSPMVPAGGFFRLALEGLVVEQPRLRFGATLLVMADGMAAQRMRLVGRAVPTVPVVVATRRLALGEVLGPGDVRLTRLRAERVRPGMADAMEQVVGQELRRPMGEGQGVALLDLGPPAIVQRNAVVLLELDAPGLQLAAQGRALAPAALGETVRVMNLTSRTVVEGVAVAPGRVRVAFGAMPIGQAGRGVR